MAEQYAGFNTDNLALEEILCSLPVGLQQDALENARLAVWGRTLRLIWMQDPRRRAAERKCEET